MSDYWDAVGRVALGQPGSAEPRRRSMFESEDAVVAPTGLDVVEHGVDAPSPPAVPAATPQSTSPPQLAAESRPADEPADDRAATRPAQPDRVATPSEAVPHEARATYVDGPRGAPEPATQAAPPLTGQPVDRLEVHRIETTRTIRQLVEARDRTAAPGAAAVSTIAQAVPAVHDEPRAPAPAAVVVAPAVAVAEPVAAVPPPAPPAAAAEPPPLLIEIGRIDIRIESEAASPPTTPRRRDVAPAPSLDAFLTRRRGAGP
jgi:hypothetical protein